MIIHVAAAICIRNAETVRHQLNSFSMRTNADSAGELVTDSMSREEQRRKRARARVRVRV